MTNITWFISGPDMPSLCQGISHVHTVAPCSVSCLSWLTYPSFLHLQSPFRKKRDLLSSAYISWELQVEMLRVPMPRLGFPFLSPFIVYLLGVTLHWLIQNRFLFLFFLFPSTSESLGEHGSTVCFTNSSQQCLL